MDVLQVNSAKKKDTAKIQQPVSKLFFDIKVTGDYSNEDRVQKFHEKIGGVLVSITRRLKTGETVQIAQDRPLADLLELHAQHDDDIIIITPNGADNMTIVAPLQIGNNSSIDGSSESWVEVKVDLVEAADIEINVTGTNSAVVTKGNLFYDTIATLANQQNRFDVKANMTGIAVPATTSRLCLKNASGVDITYSLAELKRDTQNSNGIAYLDNGVAKFARRWFVFLFDMGNTAVEVTTTDASSVYVVKGF